MSKRKPITRKYKQPKQRRETKADDYDTYVKQYNNMAKANAMKDPKMTKMQYLLYKKHLDQNLMRSGNTELIAKAHKNMARYIASSQKAFTETQLDTFKQSFEKLKKEIKTISAKQRTSEEKELLKFGNIVTKMKKEGMEVFEEFSEKFDATLRKFGFKSAEDNSLSEFAMAGS